MQTNFRWYPTICVSRWTTYCQNGTTLIVGLQREQRTDVGFAQRQNADRPAYDRFLGTRSYQTLRVGTAGATPGTGSVAWEPCSRAYTQVYSAPSRKICAE